MSGVADQLVRESRVARATGTTVELVDAAHPDCRDYDADEGGRWVTVCTEHGSFVQHETWKLARQFLGHPEEWCESCRKSPAAKEPRAGFSAEERQRALETRRAKAEEKAKARAAADAKEAVKRDLDDQWMDWTVAEPMVDRLYLPGDKELHDEQAQIVSDARAAARKAKEGRRAAEAAIVNAGPIKSKREKKNIDRLEGERDALDEIVVAQEDRERIAARERDRIARRAFLRGCVAAGWTLEAKANAPATITKGDRTLRIPADYLPLDEYPAAKVMPPAADG
ncbi:MAG: hypothetical protein ACRDPE_15245 [Solirubrobacterales bacterium]